MLLSFLSDAPGLRDPLGVILDRGLALHRAEDRDQDLVRSLAFELRQLLIQTQGRLLVNHAGVIVEVAIRFGRHHFGRERADRADEEARTQKTVASPLRSSRAKSKIPLRSFRYRLSRNPSIALGMTPVITASRRRAAGEGAGLPKLKFTFGAFSAPVAH